MKIATSVTNKVIRASSFTASTLSQVIELLCERQ
jgi:hypothetical protein